MPGSGLDQFGLLIGQRIGRDEEVVLVEEVLCLRKKVVAAYEAVRVPGRRDRVAEREESLTIPDTRSGCAWLPRYYRVVVEPEHGLVAVGILLRRTLPRRLLG